MWKQKKIVDPDHYADPRSPFRSRLRANFVKKYHAASAPLGEIPSDLSASVYLEVSRST